MTAQRGQNLDPLKQQLMTLRILWGALVLSQFFAGVILALSVDGESLWNFDQPALTALTEHQLLPVAIFMPTVILVMSQVIPRIVLKSAASRKPKTSIESLRLYGPAFILKMGMLEAVTMASLASSLQVKSAVFYCMFMPISLLLMLLEFPRLERIKVQLPTSN